VSGPQDKYGKKPPDRIIIGGGIGQSEGSTSIPLGKTKAEKEDAK